MKSLQCRITCGFSTTCLNANSFLQQLKNTVNQGVLTNNVTYMLSIKLILDCMCCKKLFQSVQTTILNIITKIQIAYKRKVLRIVTDLSLNFHRGKCQNMSGGKVHYPTCLRFSASKMKESLIKTLRMIDYPDQCHAPRCF